MSLLDANDDWIEGVRRWLYPKLHPYLEKFGGYGIGIVTHNQHVCTLDMGEEELEEELVELGFTRNPMACYKSLDDGSQSEGSWALYHNERPQIIDEDMQLHVTLFGEEKVTVYAHYEDSWYASPIDHLNEENYSASEGVEKAKRVLSHLVTKQ